MTNETEQRRIVRPARRGLSVAGIAAATLACVTALSWIIHSSETVSVDEYIDRVEIDVSAGRVEIVGSPEGKTSVEFEVKSGWIRDGGVDYQVDGGTLRVNGGCDSGLFGLWCRSDVTVTVPAGADVTATASSGSIVASGLDGTTVLVSSAGDVTVKDQSGPLTAHSAAGSVEVSELDTDVAKVTSSAGTVDVHAVRPPRSLDAESSADDVVVTLPGDVRYDVETDSSVGEETVTVPTGSGSAFEVRAFSSAGSVSVTER